MALFQVLYGLLLSRKVCQWELEEFSLLNHENDNELMATCINIIDKKEMYNCKVEL